MIETLETWAEVCKKIIEISMQNGLAARRNRKLYNVNCPRAKTSPRVYTYTLLCAEYLLGSCKGLLRCLKQIRIHSLAGSVYIYIYIYVYSLCKSFVFGTAFSPFFSSPHDNRIVITSCALCVRVKVWKKKSSNAGRAINDNILWSGASHTYTHSHARSYTNTNAYLYYIYYGI